MDAYTFCSAVLYRSEHSAFCVSQRSPLTSGLSRVTHEKQTIATTAHTWNLAIRPNNPESSAPIVHEQFSLFFFHLHPLLVLLCTTSHSSICFCFVSSFFFLSRFLNEFSQFSNSMFGAVISCRDSAGKTGLTKGKTFHFLQFLLYPVLYSQENINLSHILFNFHYLIS